MTMNRLALETYLITHVRDKAIVNAAMMELEPFFLIVDKGKYTLAPASEELRVEAALAISRVSRIPVPRISFVPMREYRGYRLPPWMSGIEYTIIYKNSHDYFADTFGDRFWSEFTTNLKGSFLHNLRGILQAVVGDRLWESPYNSICGYLGHILNGEEQEEINRLTPILRLYLKALPINRIKAKNSLNEESDWYVLVA